MQVRGFCDYFGFLFITYCVPQYQTEIASYRSSQHKAPDRNFHLEYQWSVVNYTWQSQQTYQYAIDTKQYIPENNAIIGIKYYKDKLYFALGRFRDGTPVTLATVKRSKGLKTNILLNPYPSWGMNAQFDCRTLQNVQSMEVDTRGIMWVLDGTRINNITNCPPKLVMLDLNRNGKVVGSYTFEDNVVLTKGGFMNDIVIDETDGGYAYITDNSDIDPGLVVYSVREHRAWKLRDKTMYPEEKATTITSGNYTSVTKSPIDGIALSPLPENQADERIIYYCALSAYNLYAISTKVAKNYELTKTPVWRDYIKFVGKKQSQSDGLIIDNRGDMYYTLLQINSIGEWNIHENFEANYTAKIIYTNEEELEWPDSLAMDSKGYLSVLASNVNKYIDTTYPLTLNNDIKSRIFTKYTGTRNYMFTSTSK